MKHAQHCGGMRRQCDAGFKTVNCHYPLMASILHHSLHHLRQKNWLKKQLAACFRALRVGLHAGMDHFFNAKIAIACASPVCSGLLVLLKDALRQM
jgi:hypothetical protein